MAQMNTEQRHASIHVSPEYQYTVRPTKYESYDHGGFVTGYDSGHLGALNSPPPPIVINTRAQRATYKDYKPTALRWWFQFLLIACLIALVGLTEYAMRHLEVFNDDGLSSIVNARSMDNIFAKWAPIFDSHHLARQVTQTATAATTPAASVVSPGMATPTAPGVTPDPSAGLQDHTTIVPTTTDGGAGVQQGKTTVTDPNVGGQPTTGIITSDPNAGVQQGKTTIVAPTTTDGGAGVQQGKTTIVAPTTTDGGAGVQQGKTTAGTTPDANAGVQSKTTILSVATDANGQPSTVQSVGLATTGMTATVGQAQSTTSIALFQQTTTLPNGQTSMVDASITVNPGESLTTLATVAAVTLGGSTEILATTWTDAQGQLHSSSYTTVIGGRTSSVTLQSVVATPMPTGGTVATKVISFDDEQYWTGAFLPTILAVLIAFPLNLISINAKLMQPFHALATANEIHGARADCSIFLRFYNWSGIVPLFRALKHGEPVIVITDLIVLFSAFLSPIAATTISIHQVDAACQSRCFGQLGVSMIPGRALQALMATISLLIATLILILSVAQWRTGVSQNPWSIAAMASLCRDPELRDRLQRIPIDPKGKIDESHVLRVLSQRRYALGHFWESTGPAAPATGYGVMVAGAGDADSQLLPPRDAGRYHEAGSGVTSLKKTQPFVMLKWWGRCGLIFFSSGVLAILAYFLNTSGDTGFERFMDSGSYGVKFFFTGLGVALGFAMEAFFRSVAIMSPYLQLSRRARPADRSILFSPPTNPLSGIHSAIRQRSLYLGLLSFTTLLSELCLPVTLSHVPFSRMDKVSTNVICGWTSIGILGLMLLMVIASFFMTWPHLPMDPRTVAGAMFYVCDSRMLEAFEGMAAVSKKERDLDVRYLRSLYGYGPIVGMSGIERIGVDIWDNQGEATVMLPDRTSRVSGRSSAMV